MTRDATAAARPGGSAARATGSVRQPLTAQEWAALDHVMQRLVLTADLADTVATVLDLLAPVFSEGAMIALADERGRMRIAGRRGCDDERSRALLAEPGSATVHGIGTNGGEGGRLYLLSASAPTSTALREAVVTRCLWFLESALRFEREHRVALTFQNAALATALPNDDDVRFDAFYQAGKTEALVGGDWYDAFGLSDNRLVISVGDVVGSGLEAAITMMNVRQAMRGAAQVDPNPALLMRAADRTMRLQHPGGFATAFVALIDRATRTCSYANAGHPPPLLRDGNGNVTALEQHGQPLGLEFREPDRVFEVRLSERSLLVLYTDGLIESTRDILAGEARLEDAVRDLGDDDAENLARALHRRVVGDHASDDVAILVARLALSPPLWHRRFDPRWPDVATEVKAAFQFLLRRCGFPESRIVEVQLALAELLGNAIRYAPGVVDLITERTRESFVLHVLDKGPGYGVRSHLPADLYSQFGRGLFLISSLADDFVVEPRASGGTHARVTFHLEKQVPR